MDILTHNKTLTSQFIMPLLFETKKFTDILPEFNSFVDAYIADFDKPENDNKIILVFKTKQKDLPELNQVDKYTKKIKDGKEELFVYVYDLPEKFNENYVFMLTGKYSAFSDEAKKIILNFWDAKEGTLIHSVLYKTGTALKKFFKSNFNKELNPSKWLNEDEEWWIEPNLSKEIYGAE